MFYFPFIQLFCCVFINLFQPRSHLTVNKICFHYVLQVPVLECVPLHILTSQLGLSFHLVIVVTMFSVVPAMTYCCLLVLLMFLMAHLSTLRLT